MEEDFRKKILVAVDGSVYSNNAINYLVDLFKDIKELRLDLFTVVSSGGLPEAGREWMDELTLMTTMSPQARNRYSRARRYTRQAMEHMVRLGVEERRITAEVQIARVGTAADIVQKARSGMYDALVIGRRGVGKMEELFMGSVSATVLGKSHDIPVWIVDKKVKSDRFLVPVDGSFHSLSAVDHLGFILGNHPTAEITLFHSSAMFASRESIKPQDYYDRWGKEWCDRYLHGPDSLHQAPRQLLLEAGFPKERIFWLHTSKGIEPARQIIRQALMDEFGTIVMGRRSDASARGLLKSVSDRVVFMADRVAIWIVG
jgi:nucleotide-binding universal stress UspA family protein